MKKRYLLAIGVGTLLLLLPSKDLSSRAFTAPSR